MKEEAFDHQRSCWPTICITTLLLLLLLLLLLFALAKFLKGKVRKDVKNRNINKFPPGRRGWPIIGDSINWYNSVASSHPPQFVEEQVQRYGKIFSCNLFGKWAVVSADPNFNRFVMQNEGKLFQSSYPKSFRDLVGKNGVITAQGEQQRKLHSIASNMMRLEKLKFYFLQDIQIVLRNTLNNLHDNQIIHLQDICRKVAINLMVNQLLGVSNESEVNEMSQQFSDFADGCLSIPINFPGFPFHTDDAVADFIINLLFAGNETTAKTMLFAVYFLTQCPKAMKQLLRFCFLSLFEREKEQFGWDEQQRVEKTSSGFGEEVMLSWQDYKAMPFTQCVIDETLRLGGIAIWLMREAKETIEYQDYVIPKGCFVVPFLSAVHLNEGIYEEALSFNPWRWMDSENQEKRNWRSSPVFAPFGGGARFCPGAELARLQIALFLNYFVSTFRWNQLKEDRMSFFPSARLVNGFQIQLGFNRNRRHLDGEVYI